MDPSLEDEWMELERMTTDEEYEEWLQKQIETQFYEPGEKENEQI